MQSGLLLWDLFRKWYKADAPRYSLADLDRDIGGRKWVYVASITCYAILNFVSLGTWELIEIKY